MKSSSNCCDVKPIKNARNAKECLFNDLISLLQSLNVNFTSMSVETLGKNVVQTLCDSLWYFTSHYKCFFDHSCPIPDLMSTCKDLNDYQSQKS